MTENGGLSPSLESILRPEQENFPPVIKSLLHGGRNYVIESNRVAVLSQQNMEINIR